MRTTSHLYFRNFHDDLILLWGHQREFPHHGYASLETICTGNKHIHNTLLEGILFFICWSEGTSTMGWSPGKRCLADSVAMQNNKSSGAVQWTLIPKGPVDSGRDPKSLLSIAEEIAVDVNVDVKELRDWEGVTSRLHKRKRKEL